MSRQLPEPRGKLETTVRRLALAAMSVTHHDIDTDEIEAVHEIEAMERRFTKILRGRYRS